MEKNQSTFRPIPIKNRRMPRTNSLNTQEFNEMMAWLGNESKPLLDYILYLMKEKKYDTAIKLYKENETLFNLMEEDLKK